jgi:hypothetical protein
MARIPHSAKTLIAQVQARYNRKPDSRAGTTTGTPVGDPDGLGVVRKVRFDKTSSQWLKDILPVMDDSRIVDFAVDDGRVVVEFSHRVDADRREKFPLAEATLVAGE